MESICFSSQRLFLWQRKQLAEKENVHDLYCTSMFRDQQSTFPSTAKVICGYFHTIVNDNSSQGIFFFPIEMNYFILWLPFFMLVAGLFL